MAAADQWDGFGATTQELGSPDWDVSWRSIRLSTMVYFFLKQKTAYEC